MEISLHMWNFGFERLDTGWTFRRRQKDHLLGGQSAPKCWSWVRIWGHLDWVFEWQMAKWKNGKMENMFERSSQYHEVWFWRLHLESRFSKKKKQVSRFWVDHQNALFAPAQSLQHQWRVCWDAFIPHRSLIYRPMGAGHGGEMRFTIHLSREIGMEHRSWIFMNHISKKYV